MAIDNVLGALADPCRREIVEILVTQPRRAGELADATGLSRSRVSKHLKILNDAGVIRDARVVNDARGRVFSIDGGAMDNVRVWLDQLQREWDIQLAAFKEHVEDTHNTKSEEKTK